MKILKVRTIVLALGTAILSATLLVPATFAQSPMKADVPFAFYVQGKLMPAGVYTVKRLSGSSVLCIDNQKGDAMFIGTIPTTNKVEQQSRLVFTRIGSVSFLSELDWSGYDVGHALMKSSYERELLAGNSPVRVALLGK